MPHRDSYPHSVPCWVVLQTTDQDAAKAFYAALFGWGLDDGPLPTGGHSTMARRDRDTGNQPGALLWNELITREPERAAAFYDARLGTTHDTRPMGDGETDTGLEVDEGELQPRHRPARSMRRYSLMRSSAGGRFTLSPIDRHASSPEIRRGAVSSTSCPPTDRRACPAARQLRTQSDREPYTSTNTYPPSTGCASSGVR